MKKLLCVLLAALLCFGLGACREEPDPVAPDVPDEPDDPVVPVSVDWAVEPTLQFGDIQVLELYYDAAVLQRTKYLAFEQSGRWGLLDLDLNVVVPAVSQDIPFFCPAGELHLTASDSELAALDIQQDDIELAMGGHGSYFTQFVYDVNDKAMYILSGDVGFDLISPADYPLAIPDIVPVAFIEHSYNDQYDWGVEINYKDTYGYCRSNGTLISTIEYEHACEFVGGLAAAKRGGAWGFIDTSLSPITTFSYRGCNGNLYNNDGTFIPDFYPYVFLDGFAVVRDQNNKYGVIDAEGEDVLPCQFDKIVPVTGKRAVVLQGGKWGIARLA